MTVPSSPYDISQNRQHGSLTEAVCQRSSVPVAFQLQVSQREGRKQHSSSHLSNCEPIRSVSEPPLTPRSASRAFWDPKYCEAAERRNRQCKARETKKKLSNKHKANGRQFKTEEINTVTKRTWENRYNRRAIRDKINDTVQGRERKAPRAKDQIIPHQCSLWG